MTHQVPMWKQVIFIEAMSIVRVGNETILRVLENKTHEFGYQNQLNKESYFPFCYGRIHRSDACEMLRKLKNTGQIMLMPSLV